MFKWNRRLSLPSIGLDIQDHSIRFLQLERSKAGYRVLSFACESLPSGAVVAGEIRQAEVVHQIVKKLFTQVKIMPSRIAMALPYQAMISQRIKLPNALRDSDLEATITDNLQHYFPQAKASLVFDFVRLNKEILESDWLIIAAPRDQMTAYSAIMQAAGFSLEVMDVDVYALVYAAHLLSPAAIVSTQPAALLVLDASIGQLILFKEHEILLQQKWLVQQEALLPRLKQMLKLFHSSLPCVVVASREEIAALQAEQLAITFIAANPFSQLDLATAINAEALSACSGEWLLSYGLAMRGFSQHDPS